MRSYNILVGCLGLIAAFAVSGLSQGTVPAAGPGKVGLVNVNAFAAEKAGITKFRTALTVLDKEFEPLNTELKTMSTRLQGLAAEIQKAQAPPPAGVPVANTQANLAAKVEEAQSLETQIKRKQEDGKTSYERRYQTVVGPVFNDIIKALNEYAKAKGYAVILDGAKLEESGILMGFDDKYDVTQDFITFYNARPAGTAATTTRP